MTRPPFDFLVADRIAARLPPFDADVAPLTDLVAALRAEGVRVRLRKLARALLRAGAEPVPRFRHLTDSRWTLRSVEEGEKW